MGTLASELAPHADRLTPAPRVYADANVPAGLVSYMRTRLAWDVFFVLEDDALRRAADVTHYQLARQLQRTLLTFDRDYLDDRRFPPEQGSGVIVLSAPGEREMRALLVRVDRALFRAEGDPAGRDAEALPLRGRKLHAHTDWARDGTAP